MPTVSEAVTGAGISMWLCHVTRMSRRGRFAAIVVGYRKSMSIFDKLTGRLKQAAGDLADDPVLKREGRTEERKGEAKEDLARAQDRVEDKAAEVADLERQT